MTRRDLIKANTAVCIGYRLLRRDRDGAAISAADLTGFCIMAEGKFRTLQSLPVCVHFLKSQRSHESLDLWDRKFDFFCFVLYDYFVDPGHFLIF